MTWVLRSSNILTASGKGALDDLLGKQARSTGGQVLTLDWDTTILFSEQKTLLAFTIMLVPLLRLQSQTLDASHVQQVGLKGLARYFWSQTFKNVSSGSEIDLPGIRNTDDCSRNFVIQIQILFEGYGKLKCPSENVRRHSILEREHP